MPSFKIQIEAEVRDTGDMRTTRQVSGGEDLPSGGLVHVGHALTVEALRAECYLMLLSKLSMGDSFESITPKEIEDLTARHIMSTMQRLLPEVAKETLKRVG